VFGELSGGGVDIYLSGHHMDHIARERHPMLYAKLVMTVAALWSRLKAPTNICEGGVSDVEFLAVQLISSGGRDGKRAAGRPATRPD
jgi:hypothetical protein